MFTTLIKIMGQVGGVTAVFMFSEWVGTAYRLQKAAEQADDAPHSAEECEKEEGDRKTILQAYQDMGIGPERLTFIPLENTPGSYSFISQYKPFWGNKIFIDKPKSGDDYSLLRENWKLNTDQYWYAAGCRAAVATQEGHSTLRPLIYSVPFVVMLHMLLGKQPPTSPAKLFFVFLFTNLLSSQCSQYLEYRADVGAVKMLESKLGKEQALAQVRASYELFSTVAPRVGEPPTIERSIIHLFFDRTPRWEDRAELMKESLNQESFNVISKKP